MLHTPAAVRFVLAAALALAASCSSTSHSARATGESAALVVACDLANPPFAYLDAEGRPAGRDVEMMEELAAILGRSVEWRRMEFPALVPACAAGQVDVVCATLGVTPERARVVRFGAPYFETEIAVLVRAGGPDSLASLAGKKVAASPRTTSERAVRDRLRYSHGIFEAGAADLLATGEVDAVALDGPDARARAAASHGALAVLAETLAPERYALAIAPDRGELADDLDRALAVLRSTGELARLDREHGVNP